MANRPLRRFGLNHDVCDQLERIDVKTARNLLESPPIHVMVGCPDVSLDDVITMKAMVARKIAPKPITALEMLHTISDHTCMISTGFYKIDDLLHGGLRTGCITEVVGPPGMFRIVRNNVS